MNAQDMLAKHGLVVYDAPAPHIPMEDLRLALGPVEFSHLMRNTLEFINDGNGDLLGVTPKSVVNFLSHSLV